MKTGKSSLPFLIKPITERLQIKKKQTNKTKKKYKDKREDSKADNRTYFPQARTLLLLLSELASILETMKNRI